MLGHYEGGYYRFCPWISLAYFDPKSDHPQDLSEYRPIFLIEASTKS